MIANTKTGSLEQTKQGLARPKMPNAQQCDYNFIAPRQEAPCPQQASMNDRICGNNVAWQ